ncbi:MAG: DegT/DnrJ/EryC1/StrS family aminotransferase [Armatimonadetes bacterium]|nr:DegT/DnrJ/EryC1/StrS family aminotransferase [Armatimonadota bacterium]
MECAAAASGVDRAPIPMARLQQQYASIKDEVDEAIARVVGRAVFTADREVDAFEAEYAAFAGARHGIAVGSGSEAIQFALEALQIQDGDEVISVPNVDVSASSAITHAGARVVWTDIDPRTYNLDPDGLEAKITPRTRAIVAVHMYGNPADLDRIGAIATRHGIPIVEDGCLAVGARYGGKGVGSWGALGSFSFSPFKTLGAYGQGGMITTNDEGLAKRARMLSRHGFLPETLRAIHHQTPGAKFDYEIEGHNGLLDEIQAAILRVKLRHLPAWLTRRRENAAVYRARLADLEPEHLMLPVDTPGGEPVHRVFVLRAQRRDELLRHLVAHRISAGTHYVPPLHFQTAYRHLGLGRGSFPQTELVADELICLPTIPEVAASEIEIVCDTIRAFYRR